MTTDPVPSQAQSPEDRCLVDSCILGSDGAWEAFIDRFAGLFGYVASATARQWGTTLTSADRDDLVADVMLECLRDRASALRSFAGRSTLDTYLAVIARRVVARRLADESRAAGRRGASRTRRSEATGGDDAARAADREHVESLLRSLDPEEARLVRLHHLEHRSYGEISDLTGMPLNSIGPALSRARGKLRRLDREPRAG